MPDALGLAVLALAAWRLAHILVAEDGPWLWARRIREYAGVVHDDEGEVAAVPETMPGAVFGCVFCMSVWTAALMLAVWPWAPWAVWPWAVSALAIVIEVTVGRLRG